MRSHPPNILLRVLALSSVLANVAFNYGYMQLGIGTDIRAISERYENLFTPAPYAFLIWAVIHAALILYAVIALLPSSSHIALHDRIAPPFIAANVLMSAWVVAFARDLPTVALGITVGILFAAILMYRRVTAALTVGPQRRSWLAPFSLFLAWISVATIASVTMVLVANGAYPKDVPFAILMVGAAVGLGLVMAVRFRDVVFPAVIGWASLALALRGHVISPIFGAAAIAGSFVSFVASAVLVLLRVEQTFGLGVPIHAAPRLEVAPEA